MADDSVIQEVDEILAAYVEAEEAGEPVSRSDLFRRHPDVAEELRSFFADRDRFQRLAGPLAPGLTRNRDLPAALRDFGDYELLKELAQGGMGVLYKARQTSLDRIVAVKMILAGHLATDADIRRFTEEARTAASLKHKGIVPIHEVGRHNGQHYFSMDLIEGRNLAEVIRTERPSPQEAARIVQAVAEAVHYAHGEGIIHRDIKPSNILLDQAGHVQVTDFGLAMRVDGDSNLTRTGQCLGTPSYMSPEQATANRGRVGPAADVYAMGAVLYELLTGRPPFRGETEARELERQARLDALAALRVTEALRLVALSNGLRQRYPVLSLLLAVEAAQTTSRHGESIVPDALRILENAPLLVGGRPLGRYEAEVSDVATSPDGRWIAVASGASVHLWRQPPEDPMIPVHTLKDGDSVLTSIAISADSHWLATAGADGSLRLWNLKAEDPQASSRLLVTGEGQVCCFAFSPVGERLVAGCGDGSLRVWSAAAINVDASMRVLSGHDSGIISVAIGPEGRQVISASRDKTARHWKLDGSSAKLRAEEFKRLGKHAPDLLITRVRELAGRELTSFERRTFSNPESLAGRASFDLFTRASMPTFSGARDNALPWKSSGWPMGGGTPSRNMVNTSTGLTLDFEPAQNVEDAQNMAWTRKLGSQTYGSPIVADRRVFVGTNNGGGYRPKHPADQDRGVVLCFDEETGEFLWQLTREKLPQGRVNDWPEQGIHSRPCVEGERMWVVTNRAELMCLDTTGFHDDENDGPYTSEADDEQQDADIVWSLDMFEELGVLPHNLAVSSPIVHADLVFIVTGNGVDEAHLEVPTPRAPAFLAVNKHTGEVVWEDNSPFDRILHGQWSSPTIGIVNGRAQVYMPGGDGWLYAFEPETGELIWKFDLNPKDSNWELGGRGNRNNIISMPVFYENSIVLGAGQDPEHGEGVGHLYRIDATKSGDISPQLPDGSPNPNSGQIWHYGGVDEDGTLTGEKGRLIFRRTMSTVAIQDGLVYAPDLTGYLHCLDFESGERYWEHDTLAAVWASPMVVDGKVLLGDEDGDLVILQAGKEKKVLAEKLFPTSFYSTPTIANGRLFITDRSRLYAFDVQ